MAKTTAAEKILKLVDKLQAVAAELESHALDAMDEIQAAKAKK